MDRALAADTGQLLWIGYEGAGVPDHVAARIAAGQVGAVVLFARNIPMVAEPGAGQGEVDVGALVDLNRQLHDAAPGSGPPLWIAVDQEGGRVQRVRAPATVWPPMLGFDSGAEGAEMLAEEVGHALGRELAILGFDVDFAPVLDVHTNPQNPVIGDRAFATDAARAAAFALAFARGLERAGVVACGKHFPGHGDTETDSHLDLPRLGHGMERLEAVELLPFYRAVAAGVPMIMTAHVVFAALDPEVPATLSRAVITGLLRERMGFEGLVVSDDLDMRAIADHVGIGDAAVQAVAAGCDALLLCRDSAHQDQAWEALIKAAEADSGFRARVGEAAGRVRAAKLRHAARAGQVARTAEALAAAVKEHARIVADMRALAD